MPGDVLNIAPTLVRVPPSLFSLMETDDLNTSQRNRLHPDGGEPSSSFDDISGLPRKDNAATKASPGISVCCHNIHDPNGRNLVVSIDGTSNKFGTMVLHACNFAQIYSLY